jgi:hypothetical protein
MTLLGGAGIGTAGIFGFKKFKGRNGSQEGRATDHEVLQRINALETTAGRIDMRIDDLGSQMDRQLVTLSDQMERQNSVIVGRTERMLAKQDVVEQKLSHLEGFIEAKMR